MLFSWWWCPADSLGKFAPLAERNNNMKSNHFTSCASNHSPFCLSAIFIFSADFYSLSLVDYLYYFLHTQCLFHIIGQSLLISRARSALMNRFVSVADHRHRCTIRGGGRSRRPASVPLRPGRQSVIRAQMVQGLTRYVSFIQRCLIDSLTKWQSRFIAKMLMPSARYLSHRILPVHLERSAARPDISVVQYHYPSREFCFLKIIISIAIFF